MESVVCSSTRMSTAKAPKKSVTIDYTIVPYFAVSTPLLPGTRGVGETPLKALVNLKGEVRRRYPKSMYDLEEHITNPEFVSEWKMPEVF